VILLLDFWLWFWLNVLEQVKVNCPVLSPTLLWNYLLLLLLRLFFLYALLLLTLLIDLRVPQLLVFPCILICCLLDRRACQLVRVQPKLVAVGCFGQLKRFDQVLDLVLDAFDSFLNVEHLDGQVSDFSIKIQKLWLDSLLDFLLPDFKILNTCSHLCFFSLKWCYSFKAVIFKLSLLIL